MATSTPAATARWFVTPQRALGEWDRSVPPTPVAGNMVTAYITPMDYYVAVGTAVRETRPDCGDFVFLSGWELDLDTFIDPPGAKPRQTLRDVLAAKAAVGVQVRVLLDSTLNANANQKVASDVAAMKGGGGIVDPFRQPTGSQHQKTVISRTASGVVAFCGGMDIALHRLGRDGYTGPPITSDMVARNGGLLEQMHEQWHDVQVRVEGPGAADIWHSYVQRWKELVAGRGRTMMGFGPPAVVPYGAVTIYEPDAADSRRDAGPLVTQVVRTYANITVNHLGVPPRAMAPASPGYQFARNGEQGIYRAIVHGIEQTRKFIYLEDQYLVNSARARTLPPVTTALRTAISQLSFQKMIIVIAGTGTVAGELFQAASRRNEFYQQLGPDAAAKVAVYTYNGDLNSPYWLHSKTWIFDDEFAVVTSANCNRRSYTCDAEIGVAIAGNPPGADISFAKTLRTRLWLKHLNAALVGGVSLGLTASAVSDFGAAAALWEKAPLLVRTHLDQDPTRDMATVSQLRSFLTAHSWTPLPPFLLSHSQISRDAEWALIDPDGS